MVGLLDLRDVSLEQGELLGTVLLDVVHDALEHAGLHGHDILKAVDVAHLEVQANVFI